MARIGLGEGVGTTNPAPSAVWPSRLTRSARLLRRHLPARWPWRVGWGTALARFRAILLPT
jgi:hypothetical protein